MVMKVAMVMKAWIMLVCMANGNGSCQQAALADNVTFSSKAQCEQRIAEKFSAVGFPKHCEEITITDIEKYPTAGTLCVVLDSKASGVYDDNGNCVVPYKFTRPDEITGWYLGPRQ